jgi:pectate lyase
MRIERLGVVGLVWLVACGANGGSSDGTGGKGASSSSRQTSSESSSATSSPGSGPLDASVGSSSTSSSSAVSTGSPRDAASDVSTGGEKDAAADASHDATVESGTGQVDAGCSAPPAAGPLLGWAAVRGTAGTGPEVATTTGGGSTAPVTVTTLAALNTAAAGTNPAVIYVKGVLEAGTLKIGSNKTIAGICGAELHGHVDMSGSANVIFRNLKVVGYNCSDSPTQCKSGADAITVISGAHHLWFDHDDISDGSDGNLDITNGSDFVTVSWTKFWYSTKRTDPVTGPTGHRFSNLIGAADGLAIDVGHLNITWHHDWWADNVAERMPRSRDGKIHVVNCLFTATGNDYCTNSGNLSSLLVENNVYIGVNNPLQEDADGNMLARGNVFTNTTGSTTSMGTGFVPPYTLTPDATANLATTLRAEVGPQ